MMNALIKDLKNSDTLALGNSKNKLFLKKRILDHLLRKRAISLRSINLGLQIGDLSSELSLPIHDVEIIVAKFSEDVRYFRKFVSNCAINWSHDSIGLTRKVRIYLHKIHRIAPIFDYQRAKINLKTFHLLLSLKNFWPRISTQIAVVIYITDKNNAKNTGAKKLIQKNLRSICSCSAYAFHRTRNVLGV